MRNNTQAGTGPSEGPRLLDAVVLAVAIGLFFSLFLGSRPLSVPDEGRYVEIPREMVVTSDWLTPRLNSVKYFEKPPLFYWFEAVLIKLFGLSEWSVRLGPALFALFGCLTVYYAGARMFGRQAGLLSAGVLSTSVLFYALSRAITLDMPVSILLTSSLLSFLIGTREPEGNTRRMFFWGFYASAALAVLTKGLIGIVIPGMIIFTWMLLMNEWRILRSMHLLSGMAIFFAIAAPWHFLVQRANPEFFNFYFIHEHFQRYLTKVHGRYKPAWFFIPIALFGLFPWSAFLAQAVKHSFPTSWKKRQEHKETVFLLLWAVLVFLFFSASSSKLIPYILPVFPPLALLIGKYLAEAWHKSDLSGFRAGYAALAILSLLIAVGLLILPRYRSDIDHHGLRLHIYMISGILLLGVGMAVVLGKRYGIKFSLSALIISIALFLCAANILMPHVDTRSMKTLALQLKPHLQPADEIMSFLNYYQDLPVYLERRITIVQWQGELAFGSRVEDTSDWMIDEDEMWDRWQGPHRVFLAAGKKDADVLRTKPGIVFFLIAENANTAILSNREAKP